MSKDYIKHYGIEGMKKGRRRWQYPDGRFTPEGYERYFGKKEKKINKFKEEANKYQINSDKWKNQLIEDSSAFLFKNVRMDFDNWRFKVNTKKANKYTIKSIKQMNKFLNKIKDIKVVDKEAKKYLDLAEKYKKDLNLYSDKVILNQNRYDKIYSYLNNKKKGLTVL